MGAILCIFDAVENNIRRWGRGHFQRSAGSSMAHPDRAIGIRGLKTVTL